MKTNARNDRYRTLSTVRCAADARAWLRDTYKGTDHEPIWIGPDDATARKIADGDVMRYAGIAPRKNTKPRKPDTPSARERNEDIGSSTYLGRALWRHLTGYHRRSRVEKNI